MSQIQFDVHRNFILINTLWGDARGEDIVKLLDSVIGNFYCNLEEEKIPTKSVSVFNSRVRSESQDYPEIIKTQPIDLIYLCTQDRVWSQYAYQFSHELCHHVIGSVFYETNDRFGWLEEALCELASIHTLLNMSETWAVNAPYPNWTSYSNSLKSYAETITSDSILTIDQSFNEWLSENFSALCANRYDRIKNRIVAVNLLPIFLESPEAWRVIHYLKNVVVSDDMNLETFLLEWRNFLPEQLHEKFDAIQLILLPAVTEAE